MLGALAVGVMVAASSASAETAGKETISGVIGTTGTSGTRKVVGSVIVAKGVFNGVGHVVERKNHPGESDKISRDDLVFTDGIIHIVNVAGHASVTPDLRSCTFNVNVQETTTIEGGSGRFAHATGKFVGAVTGRGLARRTADGHCVTNKAALFELDNISGSGSLSF